VSATATRLGLAAMVVAALFFLFALPRFAELYVLNDITVYAAMATLALSLALVWGFGGILSLGQSVFFGIGGYAYAVAAINMGESTVPVLLGVALPMAAAALLGYFMFYGRVSDVYLAVITLTVSLIFYHVMVATSGGLTGGQIKIGSAALGGYNGIPGLPVVNLPGDPAAQLDFEGMYYFAVGTLFLVYFGVRWLLTTRFGRVAVAIRENERRAELLGYDARLYKLGVYVVGAGIAGLAGVLYANWGGFISPVVFNIFFTAQVIVWVMVGGLGTLVGPMVAAVALQYVVTELGAAATSEIKASATILGVRFDARDFLDSNVVLGVVFIVFTLFVPKGVAPYVQEKLAPWFARRRADGRAAP